MPSRAYPASTEEPEAAGYDIEGMRRQASIMIQALRTTGGPISAAAHLTIPDPMAAAKAAAHAALAAAGFTRA